MSIKSIKSGNALHRFILIALCASILTPSFVHASIFSGFTNKILAMINPEDFIVEEESSQTMDILKPVVFDNTVSKITNDEYEELSETLSATNGSLRLSVEDIDFPEDDTISIYEVKKGDTLSGVAKLYGVSKNTIIWANDLKSSTLKVGDTLVILPMSGIRHTVKKGDTILSISKKYKADVDDIYKFNGVTQSSALAIGDIILVPEGEISIPQTIAKKTTNLITTKIGWLVRPIQGGRKTQGFHGRNGVDLAHKIGTPVVAVAEGKIILAKQGGWNGGYGSMVIILHTNGVQTLYSHLNSVSVSAGQTVSQGTVIGSLGNTGKSTGPHLHFEVRGALNPF